MIEVGRLCMKVAGRDAGAYGLIVDVLDDSSVLLDGLTRRRKCNIRHLELLDKVAPLKKGASHEEALAALKEFGIAPKKERPVPRKAPKAAAVAKPAKPARKRSRPEAAPKSSE